ncbi:unnamed protein product [Mucor fragilis]
MFASTLKMMLLLYDSKLTEIYSLVTSTAATAAGADPFAEEGRGGLSAKTTPSGFCRIADMTGTNDKS